MKLFVLVLVVACSKPKHLAECDHFQATIDKIAKCSSLPPTGKDEIQKAANQLKSLFDTLDQAGGIDSAPTELQDSLRDTCRAQDRSIAELYQKVVPDCFR